MVAFDALRTVTTAAEWEAQDGWQTVDSLDQSDLDGLDELVVFSAHPDDETIALGGLLALAAARGIPVRVVVATGDDDGRADELRDALTRLGAAASPRFLGLPDGALKHDAERLRAEVDAVLGASTGRRWVLAPWPGDRHGDHRTLGREVEAAAAETGDAVLFYPVWLWQWGEPADMPWERTIDLPLADAQRSRKAHALDAFGSQHWSDDNRDGVLTPQFLDRARDGREVLIRPERRAPDRLAEHFEALHRDSDDPWAVRSRWYERRKRAVTVATLPREHYASILELGASVGELTAELAERADTVLAVDGSAAAVDTARARLADRAGVTVTRMRVPGGWPSGAFDLVVVSELAYYLADDEWRTLIQRCVGALAPGGEVLLCHWLGAADDFAQSGEQAHGTFRSASGLTASIAHRDAEFLLEVFS
ncbi:hypothetical protein GCM10027406_01360 [Leifsonia lichenia]